MVNEHCLLILFRLLVLECPEALKHAGTKICYSENWHVVLRNFYFIIIIFLPFFSTFRVVGFLER